MPRPEPVRTRPGGHPGAVTLWRSRGLRWGAAVAAVLGCSLMAMSGLMYWRGTALLFATLDRSVTEQLELLSARPPDLLPFMIESRMHHQPGVVTQVGLFDRDRRLVVGDVPAIPGGLVLNGDVQAIPAPDPPPEHWRAAGRHLPDGRILVVARGADEILNEQADLARDAAIGVIPAILLSLAGGALVGVTTERRLHRLNLVADRIIAGDLHERLPARPGGDELDRLCAIVNEMLERLEEGVAALGGVGEDIAHELRTPLTASRARLERSLELVGPDTAAGQLISQCLVGMDQALSIVTALLRISQIRHVRREAAFAAFDLAAVVRETAESFRPVAEDKGVRLTDTIAPAAAIVGDRQLILEAVVNLVDNAVKFTPAGGQVEVILGGTPARPVITVADTGPGIPVTSRSAVFERFYRADASRATPGSGLGLSLVAAVAKLHRFAITVEDNHPGCRVSLSCWPSAG